VSAGERSAERGAPAAPAIRAHEDLVYVVAKAPRPGAAKTRLCPPLTPEQAAELAGAFLDDVLATVAAAGLHGRVICRDAVEQAALRRAVAGRARVDVQLGRGLGDAMESAFRLGLAEGFRSVGVLGADNPTLSWGVLRDAFAALDGQADVTLGPSDDGGYYLLAARAVHPPLFRDMVWSTSAVAAQTLERCRALGLRTYLAARWYDVDDAGGLDRLRADLRVAPRHVAPRTRAALLRVALDEQRSRPLVVETGGRRHRPQVVEPRSHAPHAPSNSGQG
jgi:rSAM/selenodomain-associated transferase 1